MDARPSRAREDELVICQSGSTGGDLQYITSLGDSRSIPVILPISPEYPQVIFWGNVRCVADVSVYILFVAVKSPVFRPPVANLLGKGLVWAEGDDHKKQRRIIAPAFS